MLSRLTLLVALALAPLPAPPVTSPALAALAATAPKEDLVQVAIETSAGRILIALDRGHAPITVANVLHYVDTHRYDGQSFYRAMPYAGGGLIQAGVTSDARLIYPPIAHEPTSKTGLRNVKGALSMARLDPGSARSDFFILTTDTPGFDAGDPGGDRDGFAVFGHVVTGMDTVDKVLRAPVSATKGAGVMRGQMLDPVVKIVRMTRVD